MRILSKLVKCGVSVSKLIIVDDESETIKNGVRHNFKEILDSDPVYIMHTSGSTGIPKGVIIKHAGLTDYMEWAGKTFDFNSETVIGCKNSFAFDNSILDIFPMLFFGSKLVVLKQKENKKTPYSIPYKTHERKKGEFHFLDTFNAEIHRKRKNIGRHQTRISRQSAFLRRSYDEQAFELLATATTLKRYSPICTALPR